MRESVQTEDGLQLMGPRYNEGNTVLGKEFGNHIGDWLVGTSTNLTWNR